MQPRVLVLWCPDWPAVAALRQAELPVDKAAVILASGRVQVATAAARACGIRAGMKRRDAVSRCPEVTILGSDPDRDARMFEPVAAAVEEVAPGIEVLRPGLVACGARGPARYFGSEIAAAERIVDAVEALDVECRIGIAATLPIAVLAARRSVIVPAKAADAEFCASLPLSELARDPAVAPPQWRELVDLLQRLGIATAGAFAALPIEKVATRFGADGVALHRLASGRTERDLSRRRIDTDIAVEEQYDPPLDRVDAAAFAGRALAVRFHARLAAAGLACTRLDITATTEYGDTLRRTWRCVRPLDAAGTADRLRWQLDGWLTRLQSRATATSRAGAIIRLRLDAVDAVDAGRIQYGLWGADGYGDYRAGSAFARVQGLLGTAAVLAALRSGGRGPADRVCLAAWGEVVTPERDPDGPWPGALPAPAPARAALPVQGQAPPAAAEPPATAPVTTSAPTTAPTTTITAQVDVCDQSGYRVEVTDRGMLTGPPARVAGRPVLSWAGPWLLDERWWSEAAPGAVPAAPGAVPAQRRARMQVVTDPGPPVLLELGARGWLVEAVYD
jgi:protein ImuB